MGIPISNVKQNNTISTGKRLSQTTNNTSKSIRNNSLCRVIDAGDARKLLFSIIYVF